MFICFPSFCSSAVWDAAPPYSTEFVQELLQLITLPAARTALNNLSSMASVNLAGAAGTKRKRDESVRPEAALKEFAQFVLANRKMIKEESTDLMAQLNRYAALASVAAGS